jgi:hypothetical protein
LLRGLFFEARNLTDDGGTGPRLADRLIRVERDPLAPAEG